MYRLQECVVYARHGHGHLSERYYQLAVASHAQDIALYALKLSSSDAHSLMCAEVLVGLLEQAYLRVAELHELHEALHLLVGYDSWQPCAMVAVGTAQAIYALCYAIDVLIGLDENEVVEYVLFAYYYLFTIHVLCGTDGSIIGNLGSIQILLQTVPALVSLTFVNDIPGHKNNLSSYLRQDARYMASVDQYNRAQLRYPAVVAALSGICEGRGVQS